MTLDQIAQVIEEVHATTADFPPKRAPTVSAWLTEILREGWKHDTLRIKVEEIRMRLGK